MGDVTRPAPGSLGGRANESAVGGGRAARGRRALECASSLEPSGGEGGGRLRPAPPWAAGAFQAEPGWASPLLAPELQIRIVVLALCQPPHGRALFREAWELGLVHLERTCFPLIATVSHTH